MAQSGQRRSSAPDLRLIRGDPTPSARSDDALCRAFLAGDTEAFGELVSRYQEQVWHLVRRYAVSSEDTFDLAQRAFLNAFEAARRSLPRLSAKAEGELPFKAWLLRIAVNLGKNHARDVRRWDNLPADQVGEGLTRPPLASLLLERAERERAVRQAVLALPRRQREVFALRIDAGLSFSEVAQTLGITENNAKVHFHYAVKRLREQVGTKETP